MTTPAGPPNSPPAPPPTAAPSPSGPAMAGQGPRLGLSQPFIFRQLPVRGRVVRLANLGTHIPAIKNAAQPPSHPVLGRLLAELLVLNVMFSQDLKEAEKVTLQTQSNGLVPLLVSQCTKTGHLRAYGKTMPDLPTNPGPHLFGSDGVLAVTIHLPHAQQPYQSLVPLDKPTLPALVEDYFVQSAQVPTRLMVLTAPDNHAAAAIFLQALPGETLPTDDWHRLGLLLQTITPAELLPGEVKVETLLHRLFAEDDVEVFPAQPLVADATSTRTRMAAALKSLGQAQCAELLTHGPITMTDEFTHTTETFTTADIQALFAAE